MTSDVVAITGATGFLGRRLTKRLLADGYQVRILVRKRFDAEDWQNRALGSVYGDLADAGALRALVTGAHAVIHVAGLIKGRSRKNFFDVNEAGTRRLAEVCDGRRLIHVSSLAAREPNLSDYAASKRAGERAVREIGGSAVTVVRPPIIYGPGDRETLPLFKAARAPFIIAPATPNARLAMANVDDVANAIVDLIYHPGTSPIVTIGGDRPSGYSWAEIIAAAGRAVGGHPRIIPAPEILLEIAGATLEGVGKWRTKPPIFTRGKAREAAHRDWSVSVSEEAVTANRNYMPLAEGFARTVLWYRTNGWLR